MDKETPMLIQVLNKTIDKLRQDANRRAKRALAQRKITQDEYDVILQNLAGIRGNKYYPSYREGLGYADYPVRLYPGRADVIYRERLLGND